MTKRRLGCLLVLAFVVSACGGGGSSHLSKRAYEERVQAIGSRMEEATKAASLPQILLPGTQNARAARRASLAFNQAARELAALKPPSDAVADNQKLAAGLRVVAGVWATNLRGKTAFMATLAKALRSPVVTAATAASRDLARKGYKLGVFTSVSDATESLASENLKKVPSWINRNKLNTASAQAGARLFAQIGCLNCHRYLGSGGGYAGAPDLSAEGAKGRGIAFQVSHLKCPSCVVPGSPMPQFGALGLRRLTLLASFLEASKDGS